MLTLSGGTGDVSLEALNHADNTAKARAIQTGDAETGVGASILLDYAETTTRAYVGNDVALSGVHDLKLDANSKNDLESAAVGGSAGSTAVTPVLAISYADNDTSAKLGTLSGDMKLSGALTASAAHEGGIDNSAEGDTKSEETGVGISLAWRSPPIACSRPRRATSTQAAR
jgi:hypothetical protein